jgi:flavin reductase (DIM6/NTAB) family NADH-FMN oxidoreductase RutF
MMEFDPSTHRWQTLYKLLTGAVVPRPIGWVSTISPAGQPNLAPFSFFNAVCANPPTVLFCPMIRGVDSHEKDTLRNLRITPQFVINIVTEELGAAMNLTSVEAPPEVDEFEVAHLIRQPSVKVLPPRVAASPIHFECELAQIVEISNQPGGGSIVIGRVVYIHVAENVLLGEDKIDLAKLKPIGRLAGGDYTRVTDIFQMARPPSQIVK